MIEGKTERERVAREGTSWSVESPNAASKDLPATSGHERSFGVTEKKTDDHLWTSRHPSKKSFTIDD